MSARQRFVANAKTASNQLAQDEANNIDDLATRAPSTTDNSHGGSAGSALKDASNSPRPARRNARDGVQTHKNNGADKESVDAPGNNGSSLVASIDKPLNIGSLTRPKAKKAGTGEATPNHNKKRISNSSVDKLKENDPIARAGSPRTLPMSPSRFAHGSAAQSPFLFSSANASILSENLPLSPNSAQEQSSLSASVSAAHTSIDHQRAQYSRIPMPSAGTAEAFAASGRALMGPLSPSAPRKYREALDPAKREIFPMRADGPGLKPTKLIRTTESPSPPPPEQQHLGEERIYDFQVPINVDAYDVTSPDGHAHDHRFLRRTTKRIGQHGADENDQNTTYDREVKRAKTGMHTKEVCMLQLSRYALKQITLIFQRLMLSSIRILSTKNEHRHARPSTPVHRYHTPANPQVHDDQRRHGRSRSRSLAQVLVSGSTPPRPEQHSNTNTELERDGYQGLARLLGVDMECYLAEHVAQYDAAKTRWTSCSMEEWQAGANEMTERFGKLVDFVKDHMTTKLALFASLHGTVAQHKTVLKERETLLTGMRERLVKDAGMVLGGSAGNSAAGGAA
ncbi:hypothetical protein DFH11DRAFT_1541281 [Phellopilus nigrolimitatus]|nr:hypothetical protein DFH11DRAFT_1541281 [Phellopilus nigrolimitatus]